MLTAEDLYAASGNTFNRYELTGEFNQRGIYMVVKPESVKKWLKAGGGPMEESHWVSYNNGRVFEPSTGDEMTVPQFQRWCRGYGYGVLMVVPYEDKQ